MIETLLERDAELDVLVSALDRAVVDGTGSVVLVSGEAGVGKTSLVRSFRHLAVRRARLLHGACDDLITPRAYGPFHDLDAGPDLCAALTAGDRDAVHEASLAELTGRPTVLLVEDVHWADEATVDALTFLTRRVERLPALVIVTYRDDEVLPESPLRRLLGAVRPPSGVRIALGPLSARAVCALAGDQGTGLRVHASTGGNPFLVTELLAAHGDGLPASVQDAVCSRIAALPTGTQELLAMLAVVPGRLETRLLDSLHPAWVADAAAAEQRGVVELRDGALAFRHELARLAVAESLPGAQRLALGRAVLATLLAEDPLDEARILHHAIECRDAAAIVEHGPAAARRAAHSGAHQQALAHYEQVAQHTALLTPADRAAVTEEHAWELYTALRFADAVAHSRAAVEQRRVLGEPVALGRALVTLAWHLYLAARVAEAGTTADEAVEVLARTGDAVASARASTYRGFLRILGDRESEGLAELEAVDVDDGLDAVRTCYRGLGRAFLDDETGLVLLRRGIAEAEHRGQGEFAALGYTGLVKALRRLGHDDAIPGVAAEGLARARETDLHSHGFTLEAHGHQLLAQHGRWDDAVEGLRRLVDRAPDAGILGRETLAHLGRLLIRRGDPEGDGLLEQAWDLARRTDILPVLAPAAAALIERAWLAGDPSCERRRWEAVLARTDRPGATRYRGELLRWAHRCGWPVPGFPGGRPEHRLGLQGDWAGAAEAWRALGDPYERALELADSGRREPTLDALAMLDELGAVPAARLVRGRLRGLGVSHVPRGPRPDTRAHPDGLTARQADVWALVAEGLSNAEIADRLVVSVRTVDHHVSAILSKLGVGSRREAARLASRPV